MNKSLSLLVVLAAFGASPTWSQATHDHIHMVQVKAVADAPSTEGEVRKIDKAAGKVTLKHGEIKNLDMPPMTMVFQVADAAMLDKVKVGDKVRFRASNDGGKLTVSEIQRAQ